LDGRIMEKQKYGTVVCIAKTDTPTTPADYRPISLLKSYYKILGRILTNRLRPTLSDLLHPSQYCAVPGNKIFDVAATVRDGIANAELIHASLCILSLDYTAACDRIMHNYLLRMLKSYGYKMKFIRLLQVTYDKAFWVQINGYVAGPFPIKCSVRQSCPMSMLLFTLVLNPLLYLLERHLRA
jgi:hypothetical protein